VLCHRTDSGISLHEDRRCSKSEMGEGEGGEEDGVVSRGACCGEFAVGFGVWVRRSTLCVAYLLES
jgi:hypothetical protein